MDQRLWAVPCGRGGENPLQLSGRKVEVLRLQDQMGRERETLRQPFDVALHLPDKSPAYFATPCEFQTAFCTLIGEKRVADLG